MIKDIYNISNNISNNIDEVEKKAMKIIENSSLDDMEETIKAIKIMLNRANIDSSFLDNILDDDYDEDAEYEEQSYEDMQRLHEEINKMGGFSLSEDEKLMAVINLPEAALSSIIKKAKKNPSFGELSDEQLADDAENLILDLEITEGMKADITVKQAECYIALNYISPKDFDNVMKINCSTIWNTYSRLIEWKGKDFDTRDCTEKIISKYWQEETSPEVYKESPILLLFAINKKDKWAYRTIRYIISKVAALYFHEAHEIEDYEPNAKLDEVLNNEVLNDMLVEFIKNFNADRPNISLTQKWFDPVTNYTQITERYKDFCCYLDSHYLLADDFSDIINDNEYFKHFVMLDRVFAFLRNLTDNMQIRSGKIYLNVKNDDKVEVIAINKEENTTENIHDTIAEYEKIKERGNIEKIAPENAVKKAEENHKYDSAQVRIANIEDKNRGLNELLLHEKAKNKELLEKVMMLEEKISELEAGSEEEIFQVSESLRQKKAEIESLLKNKKVLIFGGKPNWVSAALEEFPLLEIYAGYEVPLQAVRAKVKSADLVLFKTDYLYHREYIAVKNICENENYKVPFGYIGKGSSLEVLYSALEESLKGM